MFVLFRSAIHDASVEMYRIYGTKVDENNINPFLDSFFDDKVPKTFVEYEKDGIKRKKYYFCVEALARYITLDNKWLTTFYVDGYPRFKKGYISEYSYTEEDNEEYNEGKNVQEFNEKYTKRIISFSKMVSLEMCSDKFYQGEKDRLITVDGKPYVDFLVIFESIFMMFSMTQHSMEIGWQINFLLANEIERVRKLDVNKDELKSYF